MFEYETTSLWRNAFSHYECETEFERRAASELVNAYRNLERHIEPLLATIPESCKGLTVHDISHSRQLWSVASHICGSDYSINPLEGFVLGASFLIHDAGLTAAAYPGGLAELKRTTYFLDRVAALSKNLPLRFSEMGAEMRSATIEQTALFDTLRTIHATRAEHLLDEPRSHPLIGQPFLLIDISLLLDVGEIVGLVAASHHWPIDRVRNELEVPRTPPARFPSWRIDALKLACILRSADACAIDERRAGTMSFILENPNGASKDHWKFQALLNPGLLDGDALLFQSKRPFLPADSEAWWLAYDAIRIADRELRDCDNLLRSQRRTDGVAPLAARRVDGAADPKRLKDLIRVSGWEPLDTSVRINDPISLIEKLGGRYLYGDDDAAPIRELIQNSADAIRARRTRSGGFDPTEEFPGTIDISLRIDETDGKFESCTLSIADDGVGMSSDVLTGALLDFGRSLWGSEEAAIRFPGLSSNTDFTPTGRFGIGFYAIFIIADDVRVISRAWDAGINETKTLHFRSGVKGRAEFRSYNRFEDGDFLPSQSTLVLAKVNDLNWVLRFAWLFIQPRERQIESLQELFEHVASGLRKLTFALDVQCRFSTNRKPFANVNTPSILNSSAELFANAYNGVFADPESKDRFSEEEVRRIESVGKTKGAVHTRGVATNDSYGKVHIGGLLVTNTLDSLIKGIVARKPATASRSAGDRVASEYALKEWAQGQLSNVLQPNIPAEIKAATIASLAQTEIDIVDAAMLASDGDLLPIDNIVATLPSKASIFVCVETKRLSLSDIGVRFWRWDDLVEKSHDVNLSFPHFNHADSYMRILGSFEAPTNGNSGYGALLAKLKNAGYALQIEAPKKRLIGFYDGPDGGRNSSLASRELRKGSDIFVFGLLINCKRPS
jgi:hypothetical protein